MLIILILLLTYIDFEFSGQNIEIEAISAKFKELNFWYILEHICYIACKTYVYRHMRNKPVHSENLTSGQIFFKEGLIWLVWGNSFSKELWRHIIHTIHYWVYQLHNEYICNQNDNKFWKLWMVISQVFQRYQATYLKRGGGKKFAIAPSPPPLDTGLLCIIHKNYIIYVM